jgi:hypothetical protein
MTRRPSQCSVSLPTVSPDGRRLGTLGGSNAVEIWGAQTDEKLISWPSLKSAIAQLCFGRDSNQLYFVAEQGVGWVPGEDQKAIVFLNGAITTFEAWEHLRHRLAMARVSARPLLSEK